MDPVTTWVSIAFLIGFVGWILIFGIVSMWIYPLVILESWMGSMKTKPPTLYING